MVQNIIIIDDNQTNIKLATMVLSKEGYNVYSVLSVKEGLELMKIHNVSLILMDAMMPEVDGYDGIKLIRADDRLKSIPILMVTAHYAENYNEEKAIEAGADDYLAKPYNIKDLIAKTKKLTNINKSVEK